MEQQMISKLNNRNAERQENYQNYLEMHRKTPQNQQKSNTQREMHGSTQKDAILLVQSVNDFPRQLKNQFLSTKASENLRSSLHLNKDSFDMPSSKSSLGNAALKQINSKESSLQKVLKVVKPQNVDQTNYLHKSESPIAARKRSDSIKSSNIYSPTIQGNANQGASNTERQKSNLNVQLKFDKVNPFVAEYSPRNRKSFLSNISQKIILDVPQSINSQSNPKTPYNLEKKRVQVQQRDLFKPELKEAMTQESTNFQQNEYQIFNEITKKNLTSKHLTKSQNFINMPQNNSEEIKRNQRETNERIFNNSYIISCGCYTKAGRSQGINKQNQDRFLALPQFQENFSIFAVSDGHGIFGHEVSQFITDNLPKILLSDSNLL